jgi:hypothetical protein
MATRPHATSEEQVAALGNVRRIPRDVDMFTGEVVAKPPKRGSGNHIRLHDQTPKPIGMAYFPGTGPEGKYCQDCTHFGDLEVWRNGRITPAASSRESDPRRIERDACEKAARMLEGIPQKGGIGPNRSCKYFEPKT